MKKETELRSLCCSMHEIRLLISLCFAWWIKYSIIETFFYPSWLNCSRKKRGNWGDSERAWKKGEWEGRNVSKRWKKLIPEVYSTHITPSYLGLCFRKKVEGVRGGRQRTRIKMGSDEGEKAGREEGRQWAVELREAYWRDAHLPSSTSAHVFEMKAL